MPPAKRKISKNQIRLGINCFKWESKFGIPPPAPPGRSVRSFMSSPFKLVTDFKPQGDQPEAIAKLTAGVRDGKKHQTLLGVTGSGKTFTMAHVIANIGQPTLVI